MVFGTLALTFIGALFAQVNPIVLKYTVDEVTKLTQLPHPMSEGIHVLILISIILLGKELANIFIQFGQKFYGEKILNIRNQSYPCNISNNKPFKEFVSKISSV